MASFLLFFFGITKNRRFGRLVYCLRDSVLQNNDFSHKKGVLFDAIPMFLCFFCELFRHGLRRAQTLSCKGFLPLIYKSALIKNILYAD